jgi:hypothetical protein
MSAPPSASSPSSTASSSWSSAPVRPPPTSPSSSGRSTTATSASGRPRRGRIPPRRVSAPHEFRWLKPDRESYRYGDHPHVSIEDRVFVECVGGDLTIKVEDNTATGEGIYAEPVDDRHQKVDDAEILRHRRSPHPAQDPALQGVHRPLFHLQRETANRRARRFHRPVLRPAARRPRPDLSRRLLPRDRRVETVRRAASERSSSNGSSMRPTARIHCTCSTTG